MLEKGQWLTGGAVGLVEIVSVGKKRMRLRRFGGDHTYFGHVADLEKSVSEGHISVVDEGSHAWNEACKIEQTIAIEDIAAKMSLYGIKSIKRYHFYTEAVTGEGVLTVDGEVDADELQGEGTHP
jgi:hypothetical protein